MSIFIDFICKRKEQKPYKFENTRKCIRNVLFGFLIRIIIGGFHLFNATECFNHFEIEMQIKQTKSNWVDAYGVAINGLTIFQKLNILMRDSTFSSQYNLNIEHSKKKLCQNYNHSIEIEHYSLAAMINSVILFCD